MQRVSALATFLLAAAALAPAQSRRAPAPDGSDNDIHLVHITLKDLISRAYQLAPQQIFGPAWLDGARLDMVAQVPPGATRDQIAHALQVHLAQRFKLAAHRQSRVMPVFLLEVAKGGPKLDETPAWNRHPGTGACEPRRKRSVCRMMSMPELAVRLQNGSGVAPVFDRTGLTGVYDFSLYSLKIWGLPSNSPTPVKFIAQSLQEQLESLGLTLRQSAEPVEILIVDHCEKKPAGN